MLSQKEQLDRILKALAEGSREYEAMDPEDRARFLPYKLRWAMTASQRLQEALCEQEAPATP